jgi:hypothetical protein
MYSGLIPFWQEVTENCCTKGKLFGRAGRGTMSTDGAFDTIGDAGFVDSSMEMVLESIS